MILSIPMTNTINLSSHCLSSRACRPSDLYLDMNPMKKECIALKLEDAILLKNYTAAQVLTEGIAEAMIKIIADIKVDNSWEKETALRRLCPPSDFDPFEFVCTPGAHRYWKECLSLLSRSELQMEPKNILFFNTPNPGYRLQHHSYDCSGIHSPGTKGSVIFIVHTLSNISLDSVDY